MIDPVDLEQVQKEVSDQINGMLKTPCLFCGGKGYLKAMQGLAIFGGGSIRGPDTRVTCPHCGGKKKEEM